jgi:hypothetical protein
MAEEQACGAKEGKGGTHGLALSRRRKNGEAEKARLRM